MTRILERYETGPLRLARESIDGDAVLLCRCGLSVNQPFCDGTHKQTRNEVVGRLVRYVREGSTVRAQPVSVQVLEEEVSPQ